MWQLMVLSSAGIAMMTTSFRAAVSHICTRYNFASHDFDGLDADAKRSRPAEANVTRQRPRPNFWPRDHNISVTYNNGQENGKSWYVERHGFFGPRKSVCVSLES